MTSTIAAQAVNLHGLTGKQPVGHTQIAAVAQYTGTITSLYRAGHDYWAVRTMDSRDAFRLTWTGVSAVTYIHQDAGSYLVHRSVEPWWAPNHAQVEVGRRRTLKGAIDAAVAESAHRWRCATT